MNLGKYSKYINFMYTDKLSIKRYIEVKNEDGSTDISSNPEFIDSLIDIPCRISTMKEDEHNISTDINESNIKYKIFCNSSVDIKKGDQVYLKRVIDNIVVDEFIAIASKPIKYDLSQEFIVYESDVV